MNFSFENLGALDQAEISLNNLTIVCGENNMGKTYLAYAIFGFLKMWPHSFDTSLPSIDFKKLRETGSLDVDLKTSFLDHSNTIIGKATKDYTSHLHDILAAQEDRFQETVMGFSVPISDKIFQPAYEKEFRSEKGNRIISFTKEAGSSFLKINAVLEGEDKVAAFPSGIVSSVIKEVVWQSVIPNPFIVSTERTGATTFQSDLNLAKNRLIEAAHRFRKEDDFTPMKLIHSVFNTGYPFPVNENVEFIGQLNKIENQKSQIVEKHPEIIAFFDDIVGGKYKASKEGQINFITKKNHQKLRMSESSSSVRSLVILSYYLRHVARSGDLLIIDEPELNLHPSSQRKLARLLAMLTQIGIKVLVTTHSDYFVKEINTLIMLNGAGSAAQEIRRKYHYEDNETLSPDRVSLYMIINDLAAIKGQQRKVRANVLKKANIDPNYGIEAETFDQTINLMNEIQEKLWFCIGEEKTK